MSIDTPREDYSPDLDFSPSLDPYAMFQHWFNDASGANIAEPNAMALATVNAKSLQPNIRMVLLKEVRDNDFYFYSNRESTKAQEIASNNRVALCFYWDAIHRQVRILGTIRELSDEIVAAYFKSRPRGAQIGAWVSKQSRPLPSSEQLLSEYEEFQARHKDDSLGVPPHWGGYCVKPLEFEFWQGAKNRLHQRVRYTLSIDQQGETQWQQTLLYP